MNKKRMGRRDFLKMAGLGALGAAGACTAPGIFATPTPSVTPMPTIPMFPTDAVTSTPAPPPTIAPTATAEPMAALQAGWERVLRIAHMTDWHMLPAYEAEAGMRQALRAVQQQADPPDIVFNTGDCVMDSLHTAKDRVEVEWETFRQILDEECTLPIVHAIGNHDVWGWGIADEWIHDDPDYGKQMAIKQLGLKDRYYSFDQAGWHFVVLDSIHRRNAVSKEAYIGQLDDEQRQWLINDVQSVTRAGSTPICIVSHIPVLSACEYFDGPNEESGNWVVPASWMHIDARKFRALFLESPNIKLCLSGHTHQYESLDYLGVRYITSGAVSGNWWRGEYMSFPPAYVMVNLYSDGTADSEFVAY
jgi:3',5'-cyclic AMP phosphodiesterase CpdA